MALRCLRLPDFDSIVCHFYVDLINSYRQTSISILLDGHKPIKNNCELHKLLLLYRRVMMTRPSWFEMHLQTKMLLVTGVTFLLKWYKRLAKVLINKVIKAVCKSRQSNNESNIRHTDVVYAFRKSIPTFSIYCKMSFVRARKARWNSRSQI